MSFLTEHGFRRIDSEIGLYIRNDIILGSYVDDILILGMNTNGIEDAKKLLSLRLNMKDLGIAKK